MIRMNLELKVAEHPCHFAAFSTLNAKRRNGVCKKCMQENVPQSPLQTPMFNMLSSARAPDVYRCWGKTIIWSLSFPLFLDTNVKPPESFLWIHLCFPCKKRMIGPPHMAGVPFWFCRLWRRWLQQLEEGECFHAHILNPAHAQMKLRTFACRFSSLVPSGPWPSSSSEPGGWRPLPYGIPILWKQWSIIFYKIYEKQMCMSTLSWESYLKMVR